MTTPGLATAIQWDLFKKANDSDSGNNPAAMGAEGLGAFEGLAWGAHQLHAAKAHKPSKLIAVTAGRLAAPVTGGSDTGAGHVTPAESIHEALQAHPAVQSGEFVTDKALRMTDKTKAQQYINSGGLQSRWRSLLHKFYPSFQEPFSLQNEKTHHLNHAAVTVDSGFGASLPRWNPHMGMGMLRKEEFTSNPDGHVAFIPDALAAPVGLGKKMTLWGRRGGDKMNYFSFGKEHGYDPKWTNPLSHYPVHPAVKDQVLDMARQRLDSPNDRVKVYGDLANRLRQEGDHVSADLVDKAIKENRKIVTISGSSRGDLVAHRARLLYERLQQQGTAQNHLILAMLADAKNNPSDMTERLIQGMPIARVGNTNKLYPGKGQEAMYDLTDSSDYHWGSTGANAAAEAALSKTPTGFVTNFNEQRDAQIAQLQKLVPGLSPEVSQRLRNINLDEWNKGLMQDIHENYHGKGLGIDSVNTPEEVSQHLLKLQLKDRLSRPQGYIDRAKQQLDMAEYAKKDLADRIIQHARGVNAQAPKTQRMIRGRGIGLGLAGGALGIDLARRLYEEHQAHIHKHSFHLGVLECAAEKTGLPIEKLAALFKKSDGNLESTIAGSPGGSGSSSTLDSGLGAIDQGVSTFNNTAGNAATDVSNVNMAHNVAHMIPGVRRIPRAVESLAGKAAPFISKIPLVGEKALSLGSKVLPWAGRVSGIGTALAVVPGEVQNIRDMRNGIHPDQQWVQSLNSNVMPNKQNWGALGNFGSALNPANYGALGATAIELMGGHNYGGPGFRTPASPEGVGSQIGAAPASLSVPNTAAGNPMPAPAPSSSGGSLGIAAGINNMKFGMLKTAFTLPRNINKSNFRKFHYANDRDLVRYAVRQPMVRNLLATVPSPGRRQIVKGLRRDMQGHIGGTVYPTSQGDVSVINKNYYQKKKDGKIPRDEIRKTIAHEAFHQNVPILGNSEILAHAYGGLRSAEPFSTKHNSIIGQLGHAINTRPGRVAGEVAIGGAGLAVGTGVAGAGVSLHDRHKKNHEQQGTLKTALDFGKLAPLADDAVLGISSLLNKPKPQPAPQQDEEKPGAAPIKAAMTAPPRPNYGAMRMAVAKGTCRVREPNDHLLRPHLTQHPTTDHIARSIGRNRVLATATGYYDKQSSAWDMTWAEIWDSLFGPKRPVDPQVNISTKPVKSSNIRAIGYDPDSKTMEVQFRNKSTYRYPNVKRWQYSDFENSESKGKYFHKVFRPEPDFRKMSGMLATCVN